MDIIIEKANNFEYNNFRNFSNYEELLYEAKKEVCEIDNPLDKIKFLNILLLRSNSDYEEHKIGHKNSDCESCYAYENISYHLMQELSRLGVHFNDDTFTDTEKQSAESKLDQILKELNEQKLGQQIIFEEINELRELYFLGKKNWYQLFIGKSVEMVASGIISETVSKQIIDTLKELPALIKQ
jgi:hypothetical protein